MYGAFVTEASKQLIWKFHAWYVGAYLIVMTPQPVVFVPPKMDRQVLFQTSIGTMNLRKQYE